MSRTSVLQAPNRFQGLPSCLIDVDDSRDARVRPVWLCSLAPAFPKDIYCSTGGLRWRIKNRMALPRDIQIPLKASTYLRNIKERVADYFLVHQNSRSQQLDFKPVFKAGIERQFTQISNLKLIQLIALYRLGKLTKLDFRVFFGAVEMSERRGLAMGALTVQYRIGELLKILRLSSRRRRGVVESLKRLQQHGVIAVGERGMVALRHAEVGDSGIVILGDEEFKAEHKLVRELLGHDALLEKTVKLPRRLLRFLAGQQSFSLTATAITLYARKMDSRFSRAVLGAKRISALFGHGVKSSYRALRKLVALEVVRKHPFLNRRMRVRNLGGSTWEFNANCLPPECALRRGQRRKNSCTKMSTLFKEYLSKEKIQLLIPKFLKWRALKRADAPRGRLKGSPRRAKTQEYGIAVGVRAALADVMQTKRANVWAERPNGGEKVGLVLNHFGGDEVSRRKELLRRQVEWLQQQKG